MDDFVTKIDGHKNTLTGEMKNKNGDVARAYSNNI